MRKFATALVALIAIEQLYFLYLHCSHNDKRRDNDD